MVRERNPARTRPKPELGDSWVVESDDDDDYIPPISSINTRQTQLRRRSSRPTTRASAEPELIMPSIHEGDIGSSRFEARGNRLERMEKKPGVKARKGKDDEAASYLFNGFRSHGETSKVWVSYIKSICSWCFDVLERALHMVKTPVAGFLALWFLIGILVLLRNILFSSFSSALSPLCRIPGSSLLNLSICQVPFSGDSSNEVPLVQFDQLMTVQNKFEDVLQESAGGVSLPLDMKRGETSIRDLRQLVRFSQLHSKNELVLEFDGFIETARIASYDLQKFNSHVGRGVDNILATARWTKRVLDGIVERDASQGALSSFLNDKLLAPFQSLKFTEAALLDQYLQHTRVVEDEINRLVTEAQALLLVLQNLEDRLDVIHGIAIRDDLHAQGGKNEVLSQLWTMLGGNRSKLGKFDSQLRLLGQVNTYRQNAIAHVSGTLIRLQSMAAELEELRERVGSVELSGGKGGVPLSLHIENIEMGVERLERGRRGAKELENEELRKTLEKGRANDRMIDGL
ncbi:hypothetical protein ACLMJK_008357 [Lecanora helva]